MQVKAKEESTRRNKNGLLQACSSGVKEDIYIYIYILYLNTIKKYFLRKVFERIKLEKAIGQIWLSAVSPVLLLLSHSLLFFLTPVSKTVWRNHLTQTGSSTTVLQSS